MIYVIILQSFAISYLLYKIYIMNKVIDRTLDALTDLCNYTDWIGKSFHKLLETLNGNKNDN